MELYNKKRKLYPGVKRIRCNLSIDPAVIVPFRKLCEEGGMSISRVFEGIADVFLKSMHPGENFREEYVEMLSLYYNRRREMVVLPVEVPKEKIPV